MRYQLPSSTAALNRGSKKRDFIIGSWFRAFRNFERCQYILVRDLGIEPIVIVVVPKVNRRRHKDGNDLFVFVFVCVCCFSLRIPLRLIELKRSVYLVFDQDLD